jgi:hypothetical protein
MMSELDPFYWQKIWPENNIAFHEDAVYDRVVLVALSKSTRTTYSNHLIKITSAATHYIYLRSTINGRVTIFYRRRRDSTTLCQNIHIINHRR